MDDKELRQLEGAVMSDGNLWAFDPSNPVFRQVTGKDALDDFRNLRNASLVMYRTLGNVLDWLELLISVLEQSVDAEGCVEGALRVQAAVNISKRIAIEGLENVAQNRKRT